MPSCYLSCFTCINSIFTIILKAPSGVVLNLCFLVSVTTHLYPQSVQHNSRESSLSACWFTYSQHQRIRLQWRRPWFNSWVGKISWKRERLPTPVLWPQEFHGQSMGSQRVRHEWVTFNNNSILKKGDTSLCQHRSLYSKLQFFQ